MVEAKPLALRVVALGMTLFGGLYLAESVIASTILLLIVYALWFAIHSLLVSRSRLVGGMAMLVLSAPLFIAGVITSWVGIFALLVFAHGNWLSITGAARLHA